PDGLPGDVVDARWQIAQRHLDQVFGADLDDRTRDAVQAALIGWVAAQVRVVRAYHGGYIDQHQLGLHAGWNHNQYVMALQATFGNDRWLRYAAQYDLAEIDPEL